MTAVLEAAEVVQAGVLRVGGKAHSLARMAAAGFRVPPFIVVTEEAFSEARLESAAARGLLEAVTRLGGGKFAVRSSGRSEDGSADSHAGQFLTVLNVMPGDIVEAVERVFASGARESVAAYRAARGHSHVEYPAVVVQTMIAPFAAGVAFAADPVSGRRDRLVISAVKGLGESLVSGIENGETWMLTAKCHDTVMRPNGDTILKEPQVREIAELCETISEQCGSPQDIEWAFGEDGSSLYLLQSRPITTPMLVSAPAEKKLFVFDNSNIVESYPGLICPLTFSFALQAYARVYRTFLQMVGVPARIIDAHNAELGNMLSRIDGRMYYNLGNWYRLLSLLPFFSRNRHHMETMMGVSSPLPDEILESETPKAGSSATIRMVFLLILQAIRLPACYRAFMARMNEAVPPRNESAHLSLLPLSSLVVEYRRLEAALLDKWDAPIVNDFLCMMAFGGSRNLLSKWAGPAGVTLHNEVMIGQGDIISAEPARLIREMGGMVHNNSDAMAALERGNAAEIYAIPDIGDRLRAYVARFGDRRIGELKLEQPTLDDDPGPLFQAVHASALMTHSVPERRDPRQALNGLFHGKPVRRTLARWALAYAKARVRDRENLRFERTRIFGHARRVFLAIGEALAARGILAEREDVFQLTVEEVLAIAEGSSVSRDLKGLVELRLKEQVKNAERADPPERILIRGSVAENQRLASLEQVTRNQTFERERHGVACGGGIISGMARVIHDPAKEQLRPGEILVARHTDPGWIVHFANAGAVVTERGSVLSHSAIVSRELGIPCVVAVPEATTWVKSGEQLEVDGSSGLVRKLDA